MLLKILPVSGIITVRKLKLHFVAFFINFYQINISASWPTVGGGGLPRPPNCITWYMNSPKYFTRSIISQPYICSSTASTSYCFWYCRCHQFIYWSSPDWISLFAGLILAGDLLYQPPLCFPPSTLPPCSPPYGASFNLGLHHQLISYIQRSAWFLSVLF